VKPQTSYRVEVDCGTEWRWDSDLENLTLNGARRGRATLRSCGETAPIRIVKVTTEVIEEHHVRLDTNL
jgi:hypothetical protein